MTVSHCAFPETDARYVVHVWFDGCAVFDRFSGDTHMLDSFSASLFLSGLSVPADVIEGLQLPEMSPEGLASALDDARLRLDKLKLPFPRPS